VVDSAFEQFFSGIAIPLIPIYGFCIGSALSSNHRNILARLMGPFCVICGVTDGMVVEVLRLHHHPPNFGFQQKITFA
jgi:hypothetical protein